MSLWVRFRCSLSDFACSVLYVCLWHTGKSDGCREAKLTPYLDNVMITYSKVVAHRH
jgi:hypothetical protein